MIRWLLAIVIVAGVTTAHAQPSADARARAAARFKQGQEFFKAKDFDRAIREYEAAFELSSEPLLVFNIALCHDRAKRPEPALVAFQRYLELAPNGQVADEAREDVARLTPIVEALRAERAAEEARLSEQARREREAHDAAAAEQTRIALEAGRRAERRHAIEAETARLARRSRIERWAAIGSGVVGVAAVGLSAKYGLDARSASAAITGHEGPWTDALLARDAEGRTAETRAIVLGISGGALIAGAGVLYLLGRHHGAQEHELRLELQATSASLAGRF